MEGVSPPTTCYIQLEYAVQMALFMYLLSWEGPTLVSGLVRPIGAESGGLGKPGNVAPACDVLLRGDVINFQKAGKTDAFTKYTATINFPEGYIDNFKEAVAEAVYDRYLEVFDTRDRPFLKEDLMQWIDLGAVAGDVVTSVAVDIPKAYGITDNFVIAKANPEVGMLKIDTETKRISVVFSLKDVKTQFVGEESYGLDAMCDDF